MDRDHVGTSMFRSRGENLRSVYILLFLNIAFFLLQHQDGEKFARLFTFDLPPEGISLQDHLEAIGKIFMLKALERTGGVQTQAAELLKMSFRSFRYYAKKYDLIPRESKSDAPEDVVEVENE